MNNNVYMIKQQLGMICCLLMGVFSSYAQTFTETGKTYPLTTDGNKYVVSGFIPFPHQKDEEVYANALLWTIENICPKLREGMTEVHVSAKSFTCDLTLASKAGSNLKNTYYCQAIFRVADGKLTYYLSNILIEAPILVMRKVTPMEKLSPNKKEAHKQTMDDFVQTESLLLNKMFDFIGTHSLSPITHWSEISTQKPVKGMTEDECRLAFGKPLTIMETGGEIQWMYSSSFYLFFKEGRVQTIIK